jgi:hypothetical protein
MASLIAREDPRRPAMLEMSCSGLSETAATAAL